MKIVVDSRIPFLDGVFEPYADTLRLDAADISADAVKDADALVVRTRTRCAEPLLQGSRVRFIATATIGYDHIDASYCLRSGIRWTNAPGCNAFSVAQYVASALFRLSRKTELPIAGRTLGVIGVGHVGRKVAAVASLLGMKVLLNDPPRAEKEGSSGFVSLETLLAESDVVALHVPLTRSGEHKTYHLADESFFSRIKRRPWLINASRGEVADTNALKSAIITKRISATALDVWEREPDIDQELLALTDIATPHIAGYSADGKANGTGMAVRALASFFGIDPLKNFQPKLDAVPNEREIVPASDKTALADAVLHSYDVMSDDALLRNDPDGFEAFRSDYPFRREFPGYSVAARSLSSSTKRILSTLGFQLS